MKRQDPGPAVLVFGVQAAAYRGHRPPPDRIRRLLAFSRRIPIYDGICSLMTQDGMAMRDNTFPLDGEILGPDDPSGPRDRASFEEKAARVRKKFFKTARKAIRQIPFMEDVVASYYCAFDPATPPKVKATLIGALAYFVLPLDAVPDFILGLGFTDDATILMGAIALVQAHIRDEHRAAAREALKDIEE